MAYNIFSRMVRKLTERWFDLPVAKKIAYDTQLKKWNIYEWTYRLTEQWQEYSWMHPNDRAKLRKQQYAQNRKLKRQQNKLLNWMLK